MTFRVFHMACRVLWLRELEGVRECANEENTNLIPRCGRRAPQCSSCVTDGDRRTKPGVGSGVGAVSGAYGSTGCIAEAYWDSHPGAVQPTAEKWLDAGVRAII